MRANSETQFSENQLSDEQSRSVAAIVREELARRRISRQYLAEMAKISISTLEKALSGRRPFTLATTIRLAGRPIGVFSLHHCEHHHTWTQWEIDVVQSVTDRAETQE